MFFFSEKRIKFLFLSNSNSRRHRHHAYKCKAKTDRSGSRQTQRERESVYSSLQYSSSCFACRLVVTTTTTTTSGGGLVGNSRAHVVVETRRNMGGVNHTHTHTDNHIPRSMPSMLFNQLPFVTCTSSKICLVFRFPSSSTRSRSQLSLSLLSSNSPMI